MHPDWLLPEPLAPHVGAVMSSREGGCSAAPFNWLNLGAFVGDDDEAVRRNRETFTRAIGASPVFLKQVHGTQVVRLTTADALPGAPLHEADASVTSEPGVACTVLVADCLPVLLAAPHGRAVAAAHAGWRGLAGGVVERTLSELCEAGACAPEEIHAWLGACIGPHRFEVRRDVLQAFEAGKSMVEVRVGSWQELGRDAQAIRTAVFVQEQRIPADMEWDEVDEDCVHAVAFNRFGVPLATGRLLQHVPGVAKIGSLRSLRSLNRNVGQTSRSRPRP